MAEVNQRRPMPVELDSDQRPCYTRGLPTTRPRVHMSEFYALSTESKSLCVANVCTSCGTHEQVTAERVIEGSLSITRCHCRACGQSWHPQIEPESV